MYSDRQPALILQPAHRDGCSLERLYHPRRWRGYFKAPPRRFRSRGRYCLSARTNSMKEGLFSGFASCLRLTQISVVWMDARGRAVAWRRTDPFFSALNSPRKLHGMTTLRGVPRGVAESRVDPSAPRLARPPRGLARPAPYGSPACAFSRPGTPTGRSRRRRHRPADGGSCRSGRARR